MRVDFTYLIGATYLLEIGDFRIVTDPGFDPDGTERSEGPGHDLKKVMAPPAGIETIGRIDAVLLSHEQHFDNLDNSGRELLPKAGRVLTHPESAAALGQLAEPLASWESTELTNAAGETLRITAAPAVHAPNEEIRKATGETTGFIIEWDGQEDGVLYITGDSVWFDGIQEVGERYKIAKAIVHMGAANVPAVGDAQLTMNADEGVKLTNELNIGEVFPAHFEGWIHYKQGRDQIARIFGEAGLSDRLCLMDPGATVTRNF